MRGGLALKVIKGESGFGGLGKFEQLPRALWKSVLSRNEWPAPLHLVWQWGAFQISMAIDRPLADFVAKSWLFANWHLLLGLYFCTIQKDILG